MAVSGQTAGDTEREKCSRLVKSAKYTFRKNDQDRLVGQAEILDL